MKKDLRVAIGCNDDDMAIKRKSYIKNYLEGQGYDIKDCGTSAGPKDISYIANVSNAVSSDKCEKGIVIVHRDDLGLITANKIPGIRAASYKYPGELRYGRKNLDINVLCLLYFMDEATTKSFVDIFLEGTFSDDEEDKKLIEQIHSFEKQ